MTLGAISHQLNWTVLDFLSGGNGFLSSDGLYPFSERNNCICLPLLSTHSGLPEEGQRFAPPPEFLHIHEFQFHCWFEIPFKVWVVQRAFQAESSKLERIKTSYCLIESFRGRFHQYILSCSKDSLARIFIRRILCNKFRLGLGYVYPECCGPGRSR